MPREIMLTHLHPQLRQAVSIWKPSSL